MPPDRPRRRGRLELLRAVSRQPQLDPSPRASLWGALDIAKIRRKPQSQTRPSSGNVGYIGAKQTWKTAMDDEVPNHGKTFRPTFPWLAAYPAGVPARIETPPYGLLGEIAPDLAARRPAARAFTTIRPNGMAASLTFAETDRYSDAFAAYLRETLGLEPGARVAIQIPNGLASPVAAFGIFKSGCVLVNVNPLYTAHEMARVFADAEPSAIV